MGKTRLFVLAACTAAVMGLGAGSAFAGEVKGPPLPACDADPATALAGCLPTTISAGTGHPSRSFPSLAGLNNTDLGPDPPLHFAPTPPNRAGRRDPRNRRCGDQPPPTSHLLTDWRGPPAQLVQPAPPSRPHFARTTAATGTSWAPPPCCRLAAVLVGRVTGARRESAFPGEAAVVRARRSGRRSQRCPPVTATPPRSSVRGSVGKPTVLPCLLLPSRSWHRSRVGTDAEVRRRTFAGGWFGYLDGMRASPKNPTDVVSATLQGSSVHDHWERRYRTHGGDGYRIRLFDFVAAQLGDPTGGAVLDAGRGPAVHALRLAERGFTVLGIDSSPAALRLARANVGRAGYSDSISLRHGDLLQLPLPDESHKRVMCWGVSMHVPEVEEAIGELVRVTAIGGTIVISESNVSSLHGRLIRPVIARRSSTLRTSREAPGLEIWRRTAEGDLFIRVADPHWLTAASPVTAPPFSNGGRAP